MKFVKLCPVCGGNELSFNEVLWPELINDWKLLPSEVNYINRQQGAYCVECGNNLRSMALANAILRRYQFPGTLAGFVESTLAASLSVLEINEAGGLGPILCRLPNHQLACYPEHDMTKLKFESLSFDLVLHSDTLEHIPDPVAGLTECGRILKMTGACIYTVPMILGRLTRSRAGLKISHHGTMEEVGSDYVVQMEFGADAWIFSMQAGFASARIHAFEFPAALAIEAELQ